MKALTRIADVRWTSVAALLALGPVAIVACDENVTGPPSAAVVQNPKPPQASAQGRVEVSLVVKIIDNSVKQPTLIDERFDILLDGQLRGTVRSRDSVILADVPAGEHTLGLSGVREQCHVVGAATHSILVRADETEQVRFLVYCQSAPKKRRQT